MDESFIRLLRQTTMNCFSCAINVGRSLPFMAKYESFCNVQSWQHWHFVQLPMEINRKYLPAEPILMQLYIGHFAMN